MALHALSRNSTATQAWWQWWLTSQQRMTVQFKHDVLHMGHLNPGCDDPSIDVRARGVLVIGLRSDGMLVLAAEQLSR